MTIQPSQQPDRGAIRAARTRGVVAGTGRGAIRALISSRFARNGRTSGLPAIRTPDPGLITARYRQEQEALGNQAVLVIRNMWDSNVDPEPFAVSWPEFYPLLRQVILIHYRASAASAARFYRAMSYAQGQEPVNVRMATPNVDKLDRVSDSVANGAFYHQLNKQGRAPLDASAIARNSVSGAVARFALMGGRDTVIQAASMDPSCTGWERLTGPDPCSFCTMHAARGPFKQGMSDFHPHDYCHCVAAPLFHGQASANEALTSEWNQVTQGKTGPEARAAWDEYRRLPWRPKLQDRKQHKDGRT